MNSDGISYLDVADQLLKGDFHALVHPYWSPLYPSLLALALKMFGSTRAHELNVVHLVNAFIGLMTAASFTFFISQWVRLLAIDYLAVADFRIRTGFAYVLFLWATLEMIGANLVTPDLCVAALVYLSAGLVCRLMSSDDGWGTAVALGIVLSIGYFSKSAMLPVGVALLLLLAIPQLGGLPRKVPLTIASLIFTFTIGCHVFIMSRQQHRFTTGDAGRLNYAWLVTRSIPAHAGWVHYTSETGVPVHPIEVLMVKPTVLAFGDTVPGTYPLWYNPAFFHDGLLVHFDLRKQMAGLVRSAEGLLSAQGSALTPLLAGIVVLLSFGFRPDVRAEGPAMRLVLWSLAACGMFAVVTIEARYVAPYLVLFWFVVYDSASPSGLSESTRPIYRAVVSVVAICVLLSQFVHIGSAVAHSLRESKLPVDVVVASELSHLGLHPSDGIATVGYPFSIYYARLAGLRVISNIGFRGDNEKYDTDAFWTLNEDRSQELKAKLRGIGVKAIISNDKPDILPKNGWDNIPGTGFWIQLLN